MENAIRLFDESPLVRPEGNGAEGSAGAQRPERFLWGLLEVLVLATLAEQEEARHGQEIWASLSGRGVEYCTCRSLSSMLGGMHRQGLIEEAGRELTGKRGPGRCRYRITPAGERRLHDRASDAVPRLKAVLEVISGQSRPERGGETGGRT